MPAPNQTDLRDPETIDEWIAWCVEFRKLMAANGVTPENPASVSVSGAFLDHLAGEFLRSLLIERSLMRRVGMIRLVEPGG